MCCQWHNVISCFDDALPMRRAFAVKPAGDWREATAIDRVVLDADSRFRRRIRLVGEHGTTFLLDLPRPMQLRQGDGLVLEDGSIVMVDGKPEQLVEVGATNSQELARIAWHLGNRHTELQFINDKLRIRRDHVLEAMLRGLGATLAAIEAAFDPEPGGHGHHGHE
jgi:urease accessory protein